MPITEAIVKQVKYPPEKLPDSWFGNVPAGAEFAPPILDIRNFKPYVITLTDIQVPNNILAVLRARYDTSRIEENTFGMLNLQTGAWQLLAKDNLYFNFFGVAPGIVAYTAHFGMWVIKPTIAHKLLYGITLTPDEMALAAKLDITSTVEKGLLPLPISQQIEREYQVVAEETHSRIINIAVANTAYVIENLYPRTNEIIVLTRIAAQPGAAAQVIRALVSRDRDTDLADVRTFPLSLALGGEIACFIPAIEEIRLTTQAAVAPGNIWFRYTFQRIKLTNILRARFGLASKDELPGDVYDKVMAGVL